MNLRIVSIQHGDYREALQIYKAGAAEPYFGMKYTVGVLEELFEGNEHLMISLDAPAYDERREHGELVGMPALRLPKPIPARVSEYILAMQIIKKLKEFRPTHVLIRTGRPGVISRVLRLCKANGWSTLIMFAGYVANDTPRARRINLRNTALMNEPFVFLVGNHRWPATRSLVEAGLDPAKAIAWDTPDLPKATDYPARDLAPPPYRFLFAGSVTEDKGVGDLVDAAAILHSRGVAFHVDIAGSGDIEGFKQRAASLPEGVVRFHGRLPNDRVFRLMREASLVIVPSRHSFPEGLPYTLTEGLASRTPLISSDHPVMVRAFQDGEGLRFFRASDPTSLADTIQAVLSDPEGYRRLSETTADALARVACPTAFHDVLDRWKQTFPNGQA